MSQHGAGQMQTDMIVLCDKTCLQRGVGFAGVGRSGVVDDAPLQRPRHRVPLVRLGQVHCLDEVPVASGATGHHLAHAAPRTMLGT